MYATDTQAFSAMGTLTDNTTQDLTPQSAWSSSEPAVASVALGAVTALAPGTTALSALYTYTNSQGAVTTVSGATVLTVKAASALTLPAPASSLYVGQSMLITLTAADPAGPQGLMVSLAASGGVSVPQTVLIAANQSQATFTVTATALEAATVTASAAGRLPGSLTLAVLAPFSITKLTPASGPVGTPVSISGAGFDPNPAANEVRFNGERAIVGAASATELRVIVPIRASTGLVTITTTGGTVTSPIPFTVQPLQAFDIAVDPAALQIPRNGIATARVRLSSLGLSAYAHGVALSVTGLPAGLAYKIEPAQLSAASDVILTFSADGTPAPGSYALTVTGTGPLDIGSTVRTKPLTLAVLAPDATTVSGRVLHAEDDTPFVGARIRLGTQQASTDETGLYRFVNPTVLGDQVVLIDGHTNNTAATEYPSAIALPVMIVAGGDNKVLTSYIQAVDATKYTAIVPGQAISVTPSDLPNYALNIPPGAVLMGWDGTPVTKVSVRTVPVDRLPIKPLPEGMNTRTVYLYYFFREGGANPSTPIPVTMANDLDAVPGEKIDLWYYDESVTPDPNSNQWRIMGTGTVSDDGKSIVSDPGVGIPKFCCGASAPSRRASTPTGSNGGNGKGPCSCHPVDLASGNNLAVSVRRFGIASLLPFHFSSGYRSTDNRIGLYGRGTSHAYDWTVVEVGGAMQVTTPQGVQYLLALEADDAYRMRAGRSGALGWEVRKTASGRTLRFADGTEYEFASPGFLNRVRDANGNQLVFELNYAGYPVSVTDAAGRKYTFTRNGALIGSITDPLGRSVSFDYDGSARLIAHTDAGGATIRYEYDAAGRIAKKTDPRGAVWTFDYDGAGRTIRETLPEGGEMRYAYTVAGGTVTETRMTDARGNVTAYRFNGQGFPVKVVDALGGVTAKQYDPSTNLLLSKTDPLGRMTRYTYDARGNRSSVKDGLGHFTLIDYDPLFNKPTTIKDALGHTTTSIYDGKGNLASSTNGEGEATHYTYTLQGKLQTSTDPPGRVTRFDYDGEGNLIRATDALGNATDLAYDTANRLASLTAPRGETSRYGYDALDRETQLTDALSGVTAYAYDANDNLLAVTDPLGRTIETNVFDLRNRLIRKTDAKARSTTYQYDLNGNVAQTTDRRGRTTVFEYDALDRVVKLTDADGRITQYSYDLAGNMSRISDSTSGEILLSYDELNRLVRVATDQGTVEYAFDAIGRRTRRTVNGTDATDITYDRANRVKSIAFRGRTVAYQYDTGGRLTKKTLPNGMAQEYQYDDANRLTQIQYKKSDNTLIETLAYAYDANGDRIQKDSGASSVRETGFMAQYDEANRLTQLTVNPGAANERTYALAYDDNGSLIAKTNTQDAADKTTYAWDAKNRLTAIQGPGLAASFKYDALGRRIERTVNGQTVGYLYDGAQAIAELNGSSVVAAYHTGIELDEVLARHAASGSRTLLQDALGSAIARANDDQSLQNRYAYTPYGEVQSVGPAEENPLQYTGRENDSTGLYYYRARYYDSVLKRFISEDPIGLAGGINTYVYVNNAPTMYADPDGLCPAGDIQCKNGQRSAGLPNPGNNATSPQACFAICMAAKGFVSIGISYAAGGAARGVGGAVGRAISNVNSAQTAAGQSVIVGSELAAYEFCVRECPGKEPETCPVNLGDMNVP